MSVRCLAMLAFLCVTTACGRQHMADQPRLDPEAGSDAFTDGRAARPPPAGTVPYGSRPVAGRPAWSRSLILRGRERFEIYCAPCHGSAGDGDGFIVERGFPAPPSYHDPRLRAADDEHFYFVISAGYGVMFDYAEALDPADRWAVVAWIRTLQYSRHAATAGLPAATRRALAEAGP